MAMKEERGNGANLHSQEHTPWQASTLLANEEIVVTMAVVVASKKRTVYYV